jgi:hypothetical protein
MSAVSRRTRQELDAANEELAILRAENDRLHSSNLDLQGQNVRLDHRCRLAYLEGIDQGRALAYREVC